ncbi:legumain-like [Haemaphysalis longicornis]
MSVEQSMFPRALLITVLAAAVAAQGSRVNNDGKRDQPKLWALLVAGSKGYDNYRHQADICHAYQVLHNHGVPDERIVVMMYDDIANNPENPTPGVIINNPNGMDVYRGVPKDYTGKLVNPKNFLLILQGRTVDGGSGKVIASGPNDHVFVNFVGHGGSSVISFPDGTLHAIHFASVIEEMHRAKMFSKMVIYMDAGYSGSMFQNILPDNVNAYATTSANSFELPNACYPDDFRKTYLGDAYSVKWMEYSDKEDLRKTTLIDQFIFLKHQVKNSHVMQYGNLNIGKLSLSEFQGAQYAPPIPLPETPCHPVSSIDAPIAILRHEMRRASSPEALLPIWRKLRRELRKRSFIDEKVTQMATIISKSDNEITKALLSMKLPLTNFDCFEEAVEHFNSNCFDLSQSPYALAVLLPVLVNMCEGCVYTTSRIQE